MARSRKLGAFSLGQPLDRVAIAAMVVLSVLIGLLLLGGEHTAPKVREFSWQGKNVGADDTAFILSFNRPMDRKSVEQSLQITPPLKGKPSWAGRRMAYTLSTPAPYGRSFQLAIQGAKGGIGTGNAVIQSFQGQFQTRDRAFAYIGIEGEEEGRLVLCNLTQNGKKTILTSKDLVVMDFKPYPYGDRLLFSASPRTTQSAGFAEQKLYTVSTGIVTQPAQDVTGTTDRALPTHDPAGKITLVLDSQDYQNLKFDLSADGRIIIVQRVNRKDPADFGPWMLKTGEAPQPLKGEPGGDFLITPDSNSLAIAQGQGLAILPLVPDAKPLDFLPKFGVVVSFSQDGSLATMIKFNTDKTRSLFLVSNQGTQKELLKIQGSILDAQFDPSKKTLYCLLTELKIEGEIYREDPFLATLDIETGKMTPLIRLPGQRDTQISLAPDGLGILFDQAIEAKQPNASGNLRGSSGRAIASSALWLLPIDPANPAAPPQPESLPFTGLRPRWLP